jgi:hypothetical protein
VTRTEKFNGVRHQQNFVLLHEDSVAVFGDVLKVVDDAYKRLEPKFSIFISLSLPSPHNKVVLFNGKYFKTVLRHSFETALARFKGQIDLSYLSDLFLLQKVISFTTFCFFK